MTLWFCFLHYTAANLLSKCFLMPYDFFYKYLINVFAFHQLPVGRTPAGTAEQNPDGYSYLCVDGSKVSVKDKACSWAARPWQGLIGHNDVLAQLSPLREKIRQLSVIGKFLNVLLCIIFFLIFSLHDFERMSFLPVILFFIDVSEWATSFSLLSYQLLEN